MNERDSMYDVQALVDGQLTGAKAREIAALVDRDEPRRALRDELRSVKALLREHQLEHPVPESREFYWSQIRRRIEASSAGRVPGAASLGWWLRWLVPVGATALLCVYWLMPTDPGSGGPTAGVLVGHEIETPLAETTSFSFRSESAAMTVVWVETRGLHNSGLGQ